MKKSENNRNIENLVVFDRHAIEFYNNIRRKGISKAQQRGEYLGAKRAGTW